MRRMNATPDDPAGPAGSAHPPPDTLAVLLPGWTHSSDLLLRLCRATRLPGLGQLHGGEVTPAFVEGVRAVLGGAGGPGRVQAVVPELDMRMFSLAQPQALVHEVLAAVDAAWQQHRPPRVVIVGFSTSTLFARQLLCLAHGLTPEATVDAAQARPWRHAVERVVLLSPVTRGWAMSTATPLHVRAFQGLLRAMALPYLAARTFYRNPLGHWRRLLAPTLLVDRVCRGAPYVALTQLQFLALHRHLQARGEPLPPVVYVLGSQDEYVSPADALDHAPPEATLFIEVPRSLHAQLMLRDGFVGPVAPYVRAALTEPTAALRAHPQALRPEDIDDYLDELDRPEPDGAYPGVQHVVMVLHGIRDNGFWTKRVGRYVKALAGAQGLEARAPTPSYGFFSAWDFVRPGGRRQAVHWFLERYVQVRAAYPNAAISFVGHSNGTYLAARALELCPAVRFDNVVFAGSVVKSNYPWARVVPGQAARVFNLVGRHDYVVRLLPGLMERLRLAFAQCGGAGYFGFGPGPLPPQLRQWELDGGHGTGVDEARWESLAAAALLGRAPQGSAFREALSNRRSGGKLLSDVALVALVAAVLVVLPFWVGRQLAWPAWLPPMAAAAGAGLVWLLLRVARNL
jgi:hypothetical protein